VRPLKVAHTYKESLMPVYAVDETLTAQALKLESEHFLNKCARFEDVSSDTDSPDEPYRIVNVSDDLITVINKSDHRAYRTARYCFPFDGPADLSRAVAAALKTRCFHADAVLVESDFASSDEKPVRFCFRDRLVVEVLHKTETYYRIVEDYSVTPEPTSTGAS